MAGNKSGGAGTAPAGNAANRGGGKGESSTLKDQVSSPGKAPDAGQPSSERRD